ncbi:MAG: caspase family protein [Armatimonadetes bacterium]|nr:caspase family protein [Armatimonadota bacterium]
MIKTIKRFSTIAAFLCFAGLANAETYAICMGINEYAAPKDAAGNPMKDEKGNPVESKLFGAVNDAKSYKKLLEEKYAVKEGNIKLLLDADCNGDKFIEAMKWMVQTAKSGDQVFFAFSGHGSQIPNKDKADGKQSVIVLQNLQLVTSDFFKELGPMLRKSGISSTFVFDSCFAGGMARPPMGVDIKGMMIQGSRPKFLSKVGAKAKVISTPNLNSVKMAIKPKAMAQDEATTAFLFASGAGQTSADVRGEKIEAHGLFTLVLTLILNEQPDAPVEDTVAAIKDLLKEKKFEQEPETECSSEARASQPLLKK